MMRKICVFTGTRAEYGLLKLLMQKIAAEPMLELQLLVSGMHLSAQFGSTVNEIENDGFFIKEKVEMLLSSDSDVGIAKSVAVGLMGFADALARLKPDVLVVLGDRFEAFAVASAAMFAKIPMAHLHGGESTFGAFDEAIRHSITKMAHLHFTATETYRNRVIQLGEHPSSVFNVGGLGVDAIAQTILLNKEQFEDSIGIKLQAQSFLITFHPVTLENNTAEEQFSNLLNVLKNLTDTTLIFTKPNADSGGRIIAALIDEFCAANTNAVAFTSLGQVRYLSALKQVTLVIGNSSSGLTEAPTFKIPTINIGDRQAGRIKASSVIDCEANEYSIKNAIEMALSNEFATKVKNTINPYGNGGASDKILEVLKTVELTGIIKKKFYDLH